MSKMFSMLSLCEQGQLKDKKVLIREDLNVPMKDGKIVNTKRIEAAVPTIKKALSVGALVMVMSHLGQPEEGKYDEKFSLEPISKCLSELLGVKVVFVKNWVNGESVCPKKNSVILFENVRFNNGEKNNSV